MSTYANYSDGKQIYNDEAFFAQDGESDTDLILRYRAMMAHIGIPIQSKLLVAFLDCYHNGNTIKIPIVTTEIRSQIEDLSPIPPYTLIDESDRMFTLTGEQIDEIENKFQGMSAYKATFSYFATYDEAFAMGSMLAQFGNNVEILNAFGNTIAQIDPVEIVT